MDVLRMLLTSLLLSGLEHHGLAAANFHVLARGISLS